MGNWKMNITSLVIAEKLVSGIISEVGEQTYVDIVICPPFTFLAAIAKITRTTQIQLGAQNIYPAFAGAYTGEISAPMVNTCSAHYVILGHSERRSNFNETDIFINQKVISALDNDLSPIICVGESLEERQAGQAKIIINRQLELALKDVEQCHFSHITIAYEPVWAIGTSEAATPNIAQDIQCFIRTTLAHRFGLDNARKIRILYGGSISPKNIEALLMRDDIDGGLIGGAALMVESFVQIVKSASVTR